VATFTSVYVLARPRLLSRPGMIYLVSLPRTP
jgi:hypothetical protein